MSLSISTLCRSFSRFAQRSAAGFSLSVLAITVLTNWSGVPASAATVCPTCGIRTYQPDPLSYATSQYLRSIDLSLDIARAARESQMYRQLMAKENREIAERERVQQALLANRRKVLFPQVPLMGKWNQQPGALAPTVFPEWYNTQMSVTNPLAGMNPSFVHDLTFAPTPAWTGFTPYPYDASRLFYMPGRR